MEREKPTFDILGRIEQERLSRGTVFLSPAYSAAQRSKSDYRWSSPCLREKNTDSQVCASSHGSTHIP